MARKPKRDLTVDEQLARGPMDLPFLMLVLLLLGIGLIMMFSASYATAYYHDGDPLLYIARQAMFGGVGVVAMYVVSKINYQTFRWMAPIALVGSIFLLLLVYTPLGVERNSARRWLKLGIEFQPSEFAKIAVILFFAARLCKRDTEKHKRYKNRSFFGRLYNLLDRIGFIELVPYMLVLGVVAGRYPLGLVSGGGQSGGGTGGYHYRLHPLYECPHRPVAEPLELYPGKRLSDRTVPHCHGLRRVAGPGIWQQHAENALSP